MNNFLTIYLTIGAIFFLYNIFVELKDVTNDKQDDDDESLTELREALYFLERLIGVKLVILFIVFLSFVGNLKQLIIWPRSAYNLIKGE